MHTNNTHTSPGGAYTSMNGWDGSGRSICNEGTHKQDMGVLTGTRATIFDTSEQCTKKAKTTTTTNQQEKT